MEAVRDLNLLPTPGKPRFLRRNMGIAIALSVTLLAVAWLLSRAFQPLSAFTPFMRPLQFASDDRIMVLAPHPDDEAIGCAGVILKSVQQKLPVKVVYLTNGDFNETSFMIYRDLPVLTPSGVEAMGMVRHDEAVASCLSLGLTLNDLAFLGYPDFGTISIFDSHWGDRPPYRSLLTKASAVPYPDAYHPGALYKGEEILSDLENVIKDFKPTKIFLSHPADWHPDHQALYLYTRVALWDLNLSPEPELYPYLVHFRRWPRPRGLHPEEPLLPPPNSLLQIPWFTENMTPDEIERKKEAIMNHKSQFKAGPTSMLSFVRNTELFGGYPDISLPSFLFSTSLPENPNDSTTESTEEMSDVQRASFLGFEERTIQLKDGYIEMSMSFTRPLAKDVGVSVYFFGFRPDRQFSEMPKIHIKFGAVKHTILDMDKPIPAGSIEVTREAKKITLRVPLDLLGNPDRILTGGKSYISSVPLDWLSWRVLTLPSSNSNP
jgi:LmbE family N-acetylglucosaminyl deacetylase